MGFQNKHSFGARWGNWWTQSESDSRWNMNGKCGASISLIEEAIEIAVKEKIKEISDPPKDLEYGGIKE